MTQRDLDRLNSLKERFDKLPKTADLKLKVRFGEPTEQEEEDYKKLSEEVNDLFHDIQAFCKVKFKNDNQYFNACQNISLDTHVMGTPVVTTYQEKHKESWSNGMKKLGVLIKNMIREVELRVEDEPQSNEVKSNSTKIENSTIVIGDVSHSDLSKNRNPEPIKNTQQNITALARKDNKSNPPTRTWQKISVVIGIILFILGSLLKYFEII